MGKEDKKSRARKNAVALLGRIASRPYAGQEERRKFLNALDAGAGALDPIMGSSALVLSAQSGNAWAFGILLQRAAEEDKQAPAAAILAAARHGRAELAMEAMRAYPDWAAGAGPEGRCALLSAASGGLLDRGALAMVGEALLSGGEPLPWDAALRALECGNGPAMELWGPLADLENGRAQRHGFMAIESMNLFEACKRRSAQMLAALLEGVAAHGGPPCAMGMIEGLGELHGQAAASAQRAKAALMAAREKQELQACARQGRRSGPARGGKL